MTGKPYSSLPYAPVVLFFQGKNCREDVTPPNLVTCYVLNFFSPGNSGFRLT